MRRRRPGRRLPGRRARPTPSSPPRPRELRARLPAGRGAARAVGDARSRDRGRRSSPALRRRAPASSRSNPRVGRGGARAHPRRDAAARAARRRPGVAIPGPPTISPRRGARARGVARGPRRRKAALIMYTSGTTGPAQGRGAPVPRGDRRPTSTRWQRAWEWSRRDVLVHALPLFHVHGLVVAMLVHPATRRGGASPRSFDPVRDRRRARRRRDDAVRGADDVPPPGRRRRGPSAPSRRGSVPRSPARVRLGRPRRRRARPHRGALRAADRRALRDDRDADDHRGTRRRRAARRLRGSPARRRRGSRLPARTAPTQPPDDASIGDVLVRGASLFEGYLGQPRGHGRPRSATAGS